jgi:hypothetical protein
MRLWDRLAYPMLAPLWHMKFCVSWMPQSNKIPRMEISFLSIVSLPVTMRRLLQQAVKVFERDLRLRLCPVI